MAIAIGKPLKVDAPKMNMTRPSVAMFCVEADLTKEFPKFVQIGKKGRKHDQYFTYEHIPSYCSKCSKIGHKREDCKKVLAPQVFHTVQQNNASIESDQSKKGKGIVLKTQKPKWKPQVGVVIKDRSDNAVSSSGLTTKEKATIPVDVQEKAINLVISTVTAGTEPINLGVEKEAQNSPIDPDGKLLIQDDGQVDYQREDNWVDGKPIERELWSGGELMMHWLNNRSKEN
ncbi:OLC1v1035891C1 [Oldenlandia corymbosa var. corymbosa]|uniref:OLC1v1035891C1 n=1 Tax=Oldenlandia corymbosa var. corymbosa TaxID=529605 RepID=A0AAV1CVW7_OLDCO|nr:OLC1v1035891C1 [Oldenlandia corymbosa var. corymbosa]